MRDKLSHRVARLETEHAESIQRHDSAAFALAIMNTMADEGLTALEKELVEVAEREWPQWGINRTAYAVAEYWHLHCLMNQRRIQKNATDGIDPYDGVPVRLPDACTRMGHAIQRYWEYGGRCPPRVSADLLEARSALQDYDREVGDSSTF